MILTFANDLFMIGITLESDLPNGGALAGYWFLTLIHNQFEGC